MLRQSAADDVPWSEMSGQQRLAHATRNAPEDSPDESNVVPIQRNPSVRRKRQQEQQPLDRDMNDGAEADPPAGDEPDPEPEPPARHKTAGKIGVLEAVANGVLFHPDGSHYTGTARAVVSWLATVKSFAWSVNGGLYPQSWMAVRIGVSEAALERALHDLSQHNDLYHGKVIEVTKRTVRHETQTTYALTDNFRRSCTVYLRNTVRLASTRGEAGALVALHRKEPRDSLPVLHQRLLEAEGKPQNEAGGASK